jgi:hypothetical protein
MKILHKFHQWLYRGRRPNWIARIMNRASAVVASSGVSRMVTLEVTGRKSGRLFSLPLVMVVVAGERYLVSMLGEHVLGRECPRSRRQSDSPRYRRLASAPAPQPNSIGS